MNAHKCCIDGHSSHIWTLRIFKQNEASINDIIQEKFWIELYKLLCQNSNYVIEKHEAEVSTTYSNACVKYGMRIITLVQDYKTDQNEKIRKEWRFGTVDLTNVECEN